jgi:asparagine synthase (glutamine-hydrolysing)
MNGIFGIFHRDDRKVDSLFLDAMKRSSDECPGGISALWSQGPIGLGQLISRSSGFNQNVIITGTLVFCAAGRVDNRTDLSRLLDIPAFELISDAELMLKAYREWGENCPVRIFGDWSFVAWHPFEKHLFLARDHYGYSSMYYYCDDSVFAFATSRKALLNLPFVPKQLNELYLAQVLIGWSAYCGDSTVHSSIRRLSPAHCITVTPKRAIVMQYWRPENTPLLQLGSRIDYVEAFREIFDESVKCRIRPSEETAITMSGGLDSSAVAATAASLLKTDGRQLTAFTAVPLHDTTSYVANRFGDEFPLAQATARMHKNLKLIPLTSENVSPIAAIRSSLKIHSEPTIGGANLFWVMNIRQEAQSAGIDVLLSGAAGNPGASWTGLLSSQPFLVQLKLMGLGTWIRHQGNQAKNELRSVLPPAWLDCWRKFRTSGTYIWKNSAINPVFANRLRLQKLRQSDSSGRSLNPLEQRLSILMPGRSILGSFQATLGAAYSMEIRDPTADARLIEFCLSVPDHIYMDPKSGIDRWLIREAMTGRLPDEVRLNRRRGRQAGDLVPRLRTYSHDVEEALDEISSGPGMEYVDIHYMRNVWKMIQSNNTHESFMMAIKVLTRGIESGLFVNSFFK